MPGPGPHGRERDPGAHPFGHRHVAQIVQPQLRCDLRPVHITARVPGGDQTSPGRGEHPDTGRTVLDMPFEICACTTARKSWPELDIICTSRPQALDDYITNIGDKVKVLNMLVGDMQRKWRYAEAGFATPQPVDEATLNAYHRLVEQGYTRRLI